MWAPPLLIVGVHNKLVRTVGLASGVRGGSAERVARRKEVGESDKALT